MVGMPALLVLVSMVAAVRLNQMELVILQEAVLESIRVFLLGLGLQIPLASDIAMDMDMEKVRV